MMVVAVLGLLVNLTGLIFFSDFIGETEGGLVCNHCHTELNENTKRCDNNDCSIKEENIREDIENLKLKIGNDKVNQLQTGFQIGEYDGELDKNKTEDHN